MAMVHVDNSSLQTNGQVCWLGPRVGRCLAVFYIHQMNCVNFHNDFNTMTAS